MNEDSRARKNANRLFDSQNNNRGGVNVGENVPTYYNGQYMTIEYTQESLKYQSLWSKGNSLGK